MSDPRPEAIAYARRHVQAQRDLWRDAAEQVRPGLRSVALDRADAFAALLSYSAPSPSSSSSPVADTDSAPASKDRSILTGSTASGPANGAPQDKHLSAPRTSSAAQTGQSVAISDFDMLSNVTAAIEAGEVRS